MILVLNAGSSSLKIEVFDEGLRSVIAGHVTNLGSDGALALGIAYLLVREGAIDRDFIAQHVHGFEEFAQMVQEYPPDRVATITDVPETII